MLTICSADRDHYYQYVTNVTFDQMSLCMLLKSFILYVLNIQ